MNRQQKKFGILHRFLHDFFCLDKCLLVFALLMTFFFHARTHAAEGNLPENLDSFEINHNGAKLRYAKLINETGIDNSNTYAIQVFDKYDNLKNEIRTNLSPGCAPNYKAIENISIPAYYKNNSYKISVFMFCGSDKGHSNTVWFVNSDNLELLGKMFFLKNTVNFAENRDNSGIFSIQSIPYRVNSKKFTGIVFYKIIYHISIEQNAGNFLISPFLYDKYQDSYEYYLKESLDKVNNISKVLLSDSSHNIEYLENLILTAIYSHFSGNETAHCQVKSTIPIDIYREMADDFSFFYQCN